MVLPDRQYSHWRQLSNLGGARLTAGYGALSADHIEYLDEEGVKAIAEAGIVAVILPGAFWPYAKPKRPRLIYCASTACRWLWPQNSLLLALNMGCTLFGMTPEEAYRGATQNAARALGQTDAGTLAAGMRSDMAVWDIKFPAELAYRVGFYPLHFRIFRGFA